MYMYVEVNRGEGVMRLSYRCDESVETHNRIILKSISEFLNIYRAAPRWYNLNNGDDIYTPYFGKVKEVFDGIVEKRRNKLVEKGKKIEVDFNAEFLTDTPGESKLVIKPKSGTIHLARRSKNVTSKYSICIPNSTREEFIHDCRKLQKTKYRISRNESSDIYNKWDAIARSEYIRQYLNMPHLKVDR